MPTTQTTNSAFQTSNKEIARKLYEDCLNTGKLELLKDLIDDNYVDFKGDKGPAAFAETAKGLRTGFPDIHWTIDDLIAEGDKVVVRSTWHGTHDGTFRNFAPTGKKITDHGISIYQIRGNKITQSWLETDRLGFLQQLGVIPVNIGAPVKPKP